ncbi:MAG: flavoprotein [Candidatus Pacebacteria bacterium]|nr:flavoprotein [Candidatus Paceibacterota bacterium]
MSAAIKTIKSKRLAWAVTGSGHFFTESLALMAEFAPLDLFVSKAAEEVVKMYRHEFTTLPKGVKIYRDNSASAVPVGKFYHGDYHSLVLAPATSNTIAKCVFGISDSLPTNVFAQAGKCRVPTIVFACDTAPELETQAPSEMVKVWPRAIDLDNVEKLKQFAGVTVVASIEDLHRAITHRLAELHHGQP